MPALTPPISPAVVDDHSREAPSGGRDRAHALYDEAAGLLATAHALEAAAREPEVVAALAPTLACIETSLGALRSVSEQLRDQALVRLSSPVLPHGDLRQRRGRDRAPVRAARERPRAERAGVRAGPSLGRAGRRGADGDLIDERERAMTTDQASAP